MDHSLAIAARSQRRCGELFPRRVGSRGMTLLELVLALALSALLLMAISMALHIHWKAFDVKRSSVEQAQLVRSIQRHIADDLRSTLRFEPPDLSGLNLTSAASGLLSAGSGGDAGSGAGEGTGGGAGSGSGNSGGTSPPSTDNGGGQPSTPSPPNSTPGQGSPPQSSPNTGSPPDGKNKTDPPTKTDSPGKSNSPSKSSGNTTSGSSGSSGGSGGSNSSGGTGSGNSTGNSSQGSGTQTESGQSTASGPSVVVGLYGTANELQFDISRLPRVDQYQAVASADSSAVEIPSDVKTIVYFLGSDNSTSATSGPVTGSGVQSSTSGRGGGLMRAESDRAVSAFGEVNGSSQSVYSGAKLLAREVTSLEFHYFDGTDWLTEWNSDDQGGLPQAIEVLMSIEDPNAQSTNTAMSLTGTAASTTTNQSQERVYRIVVHLPVGGKSSSATESTEGTESSNSSDSSGSSSSSNPSGSSNSSGSPSNSGRTTP